MGYSGQSLIIVLLFLITLLSGIFLAAPVSGQEANAPLVMMDNARLRGFGVIGSALGAFLSVALAMSKQATLRALLIQLAGAMSAGIVFTPLLLRYFSVPLDTDYILGASAFVAMVATVTLHKFIPVYERWLDKKLGELDKE